MHRRPAPPKPAPKPPAKSVAFWLPLKMIASIKATAKADRRSASFIVADAVATYLKARGIAVDRETGP